MTTRSACCAPPTGWPRPPTGWLDARRRRRRDAVGADDWETTNLLTISTGLCAAALLREETRGSHWREDFPDRDDARGPATSTSASATAGSRLDLRARARDATRPPGGA